ncbi:HD-GYP domain-containing protein, partial [Verrucomicrobiota bacterium]
PLTDVDAMAGEIALNHHERWDGKGYPGRIADIEAEEIVMGPGKSGEEIPLSARIVSLADVYDALVSKRCYKEAWSEDDALAVIREESGRQFDSSVVDAFFAKHDVIAAVRERYKD